jgi:hypothetical protein
MVNPSNMDQKKIIVGVAVILVVAAAVYGSTQTYIDRGRIRASLIIENDSTITREARLDAGSTVFDLMTACSIPFEEEGGFVISINGIPQDTKAGLYWMYYINGELAPIGAAEYVVQDGDEITWRLEKF